MIIIDTKLKELEAKGTPIRVGMIGAGFMARGIALQLVNNIPGFRLVAIANRTIANAERAYKEAGTSNTRVVENQNELEDSIRSNTYAITDNPLLLCRSEQIDCIVEVTGSINHALTAVLEAIAHKKHVVLMNAELDGTLGPILKQYADRAGVVITNADGDQPGVSMNLYRYVVGLGVTPVLVGNIKGLHDPYRTPTTQAEFAKKWGQKPSMVTSFADGSKISFEQALIANATGMSVAQRGMFGPTVDSGTPLHEAVDQYPVDKILENPGIVDYIVGASPNSGVFVLGTHDNPKQQHYLNLYKVGTGPLYCFYNPYHLCHFEVPSCIARAVLFHDATITPKDKPYVEVVSIAKKNLEKGESLDGIGKYTTYGVCENSSIARAENLLPIGLSESAILKRSVSKDQAITFNDVEIDEESLVMQLWKEQFNLS
ncbi:MAG: NAD(P)-dependent oxidoreductase [Microgenomates group bacterium]